MDNNQTYQPIFKIEENEIDVTTKADFYKHYQEDKDKKDALFVAWLVLGECLNSVTRVTENCAKAISTAGEVQNELIKKQALIQEQTIPDRCKQVDEHKNRFLGISGLTMSSYRTNKARAEMEVIQNHNQGVDARRGYLANEISTLQTKNQSHLTTLNALTSSTSTTQQISSALSHMIMQLSDAVAKKIN